jgi:hypothetical protein
MGCIFLLAVTAHAQYTSGVEGTVMDSTGAVVPGASVTVQNIKTGATQTDKTSGGGYYRVTSLPAGSYTVKATASGFETLVQQNVVLNVAATTTVNLKLRVGATTAEVTVSNAPPEIQLADASVSGVIGEQQVQNLPLVGRNFYDLVVLTPGVTGLPTGGGQAYAQASGDIFSIEYSVNLNAGMRTEANNYLIDSAPVNSGPRRGVVNVDPNAESVQELRVAVNTYNAEYSSGGAITNVITRQGTNQFHGSLDEFHTDNALQTHSFFQSKVPVNRRNEFGGSFGGPLWRNRTFFFTSVDVLRSAVAGGSSQVVFTPDFISFLKTNYPSKISTYLLTTFPAAVTPTSNFQTAGSLSGINCSTLATPSTPVTTSLGSVPCNLPITGAGLFSVTSPRNGLQWNGRIDHSMRGGNDRLYGNVYRTTLDAPSTPLYPAFSADAPSYTLYANAAEIHVFSPNLLNQFRYSYTRVYGIDQCNNCRIPTDIILGVNTLGSGLGPYPFLQNNFEGADTLTWNKGSHNFTFGGALQRLESNANAVNAFQRPGFYFLNAFDFAADKAFYELNLAIDPKTGQVLGSEYNQRRQLANLFVQDNWKARSNLTFNFGLRWENFGNFKENTAGITTNIVFQGGANFASQIANAKVDVVSRGLLRDLDKNFGPRIGFAWDPAGKGQMAIRGGFGVYFDTPSDQMYPPGPSNPPVRASPLLSAQTPPYVPVYGIGTSDTPPYGFPLPTFQTGLDPKNGLIGAKAALTVMDPNMKVGYSEKWSLGFQTAIGSGWVAEANYVGAAGHHQYAQYDVNRFDGDLIQNKGVLTRLNSSFAGIQYTQGNFNSTYNAGTFAVRNRGAHGLNTQVAYTWGKTIDQSSTFGGSLNVVDVSHLELQRGLADFDVKQKLAISLLYQIPGLKSGLGALKVITNGWQIGDITILQGGPPFSVYCSAPFGPVFNASNSVVGNTGCDYNADGLNYDFPNVNGNGNVVQGTSRRQYITGLFACTTSRCGNIFPAPALGQNGTARRNMFRGPGYADSDLSLMKNTKVPWFAGNQGASLQFRAEAFNVFNRTNLAGMIGDLNSSQFGKATSSYSSRNLQFGLRLAF